MKLNIADSLKQLREEQLPFKTLFSHGSLEVEIYKPKRVDSQKPHARDEVYVVATGASHFIRGKEECPVIPGDVLFVPAGEEHRFVSFTDDFSTWVFFYGPDGGERS